MPVASPAPSRERAIEWARSQIGISEHSPGPGRDSILAWLRAYDLTGEAWCGVFVGMALRAGGIIVPRGVIWVPTLLEWARQRHHGFSCHPWEAREAGDVVLFAFEATGSEVQHAGLLAEDRRSTIEGNTTTGRSGAQDRGGHVALRRRDAAFVVACARPPW